MGEGAFQPSSAVAWASCRHRPRAWKACTASFWGPGGMHGRLRLAAAAFRCPKTRPSTGRNCGWELRTGQHEPAVGRAGHLGVWARACPIAGRWHLRRPIGPGGACVELRLAPGRGLARGSSGGRWAHHQQGSSRSGILPQEAAAQAAGAACAFSGGVSRLCTLAGAPVDARAAEQVSTPVCLVTSPDMVGGSRPR